MHRNDIVRALEERQVALMTYLSGGARTVQPHAIVRKPDGTEILEAYQVRRVHRVRSEQGEALGSPNRNVRAAAERSSPACPAR